MAVQITGVAIRAQLEQDSATQVVVRCGRSTSGIDDCGDAQRNPGR